MFAINMGNAAVSTIEEFDGIDCGDGSGVRLPFSGRIQVMKQDTIRVQVAGTCEGEERRLRHRHYGDTSPPLGALAGRSRALS